MDDVGEQDGPRQGCRDPEGSSWRAGAGRRATGRRLNLVGADLGGDRRPDGWFGPFHPVHNARPMLPVSFQVPAALILLAGGLIACFAGYRLFRLVLAVYGFILGALIATSALGPGETWQLLLAAVLGGAVGALILMAAYFVGLSLVGAGLGALLLHLAAAQVGREPHALLVVGFAVLGALGALVLQRYVIIAGTGFGGAWTALVGLLALVGHREAARAAASGDVWVLYPTAPALHRWLLLAWLALGLVGVVIQLRVTGRNKTRRA